MIRQNQPHSPLNHCGYNLTDVLGDGFIDVARLLVGSEGTLALMTEATLATDPLAASSGRGPAAVRQPGKGRADACSKSCRCNPTACDLMDRRHLSLAREAESASTS